jgi:hypothetical protein
MLLTFPSKESLLRHIKESPVTDSFLIVANFKSLAGWNLIPMNALTVLLGPNSAGKSSVSEAIKILQLLFIGYDRDGNDEGRMDSYFAGFRKDGSRPSFGFSGAFPNLMSGFGLNILLRKACEILDRDITEELEQGLFPVLSAYSNSEQLRDQLSKKTYTFILEKLSPETMETSIYLDGKAAGKWIYESGVTEISIDLNIARFFGVTPSFEKKFSEDNKNISYIKKGSETEPWSPFTNGPSFLYLAQGDENVELIDEIFGLSVVLFHSPLLAFFISGGFSGGTTEDIRQLTSRWRFIYRNAWRSPNERYAHILSPEKFARNDLAQDINPLPKDYPYDLINSEIDFMLGACSRNETYLYELNRWMRETAFLGTNYQLAVDIKVCVDSRELFKNDFSLPKTLQMAKNIEEFGIEYETGDSTVEYLGRAYLKDTKGRELTFSQVGTGYSQVIPILENLAVDNTYLYKQPEVHLHPKLQSKLADCFIEKLNSVKSKNRQKFRIIETHSEHFVLRLLRRVRESQTLDELLHSSLTLSVGDFSLVYFKPEDDKTEVYQIRVSEIGEFIDSWPDGFFDERDEEIWGS